jgi:hypothetical protein
VVRLLLFLFIRVGRYLSYAIWYNGPITINHQPNHHTMKNHDLIVEIDLLLADTRMIAMGHASQTQRQATIDRATDMTDIIQLLTAARKKLQDL